MDVYYNLSEKDKYRHLNIIVLKSTYFTLIHTSENSYGTLKHNSIIIIINHVYDTRDYIFSDMSFVLFYRIKSSIMNIIIF